MLRPFSILITEAGSKGQDTSSSRQTKIKYAMNRVYQDLWRKYMWHEITVVDRSISVAAGTDQLIIPKDIEMIHALTEQTSNLVLRPNSPYIFQAKYVSERATQAEPIGYVRSGYSPLTTQPTSDAILAFVSDSASDTTQTITIRGQNSSGIEITEEVSLNGNSEVTSTATWETGKIYDITKSARTTGTITVKQGAGGTALDTIAPDAYNNRYDVLTLDSLTDAAKTYYLTGKKRFKEMIYNGEIPAFDCCDALVHWAVAEIHESRGRYQQGLAEKNQANIYINGLVTEREIFDEGSRVDSLPTVAMSEHDRPVLSGLAA